LSSGECDIPTLLPELPPRTLAPRAALAGAADSVAESAGSGSTYSGHIAFTVDRAFQRINDEARKKFLAMKCDA
jgi:hypothetical protein